MTSAMTSPATSTSEKSQSSPARRRRRAVIWGIVVVLTVVISAAVIWETGLRWQFFPRKFGVVESGFLYRSGQISPRMIGPTLDKYRIDRVIFMSTDNDRDDIRAEVAACSARNIARVNYPLGGKGTGRVESYVNALVDIAAARAAKQQVLVHCHTGSQRTGGVVVFFRVLLDGWSAERARDELLANGHEPDENEHLIPYINANMRAVAQGLVDRGVLAEMPAELPVVAEGP